MPTSNNIKCWASYLSKCSNKISKEHVISRSVLLPGPLVVEGFPWCKDTPVQISRDTFTRKILCEKHNNELGVVDEAGASAFKVFREFEKIQDVRRTLPVTQWEIREHIVKSDLFASWLLKTLINLTYGFDHPISYNNLLGKKGKPREELVQIVFGRKEFKGKSGLYFVGHVGEGVTVSEAILVIPITYERKHIVAGMFTFFGLRFMISLLENENPTMLTGSNLLDGSTGKQIGAHRIDTYELKLGEYVSQRIKFV